jgi:hypothetical protein
MSERKEHQILGTRIALASLHVFMDVSYSSSLTYHLEHAHSLGVLSRIYKKTDVSGRAHTSFMYILVYMVHIY